VASVEDVGGTEKSTDALNVTGTLTNVAGATLYLYDSSNDVAKAPGRK
jgi:hypothetical protein